ncbi:hypothetical protein U9M48_002799 [Paspalum notatum var. saurae]|uniref:Uncharacterized protein n=1 Tax=Paspalum notatum var. saurae TaxID=547442 RepID=A0AAQ3SDP9_PASNO
MAGSMARSVNLLAPACFLLLVQVARSAVNKKCTPASVAVLQTSNGEKAGDNPVFEVLVRNRCECAVQGVLLRAEGFASSVPVDPKVFRLDGKDYLVGDGGLINSGGEVRFRYAAPRAFQIDPAALQENCSGVHEFTV